MTSPTLRRSSLSSSRARGSKVGRGVTPPPLSERRGGYRFFLKRSHDITSSHAPLIPRCQILPQPIPEWLYSLTGWNANDGKLRISHHSRQSRRSSCQAIIPTTSFARRENYAKP